MSIDDEIGGDRESMNDLLPPPPSELYTSFSEGMTPCTAQYVDPVDEMEELLAWMAHPLC